MSGGRSDVGGEIIEEHREVVKDIPAQHGHGEIIEKTTFDRQELSLPRGYHGRSRSVGPAPRIIDARPVEYVERSNKIDIGPLVLLDNRRSKDEHTVKTEIIRREGRSGDLIVYEEVSRDRDRGNSSSDRIEIRKDKKGRMSISVPKK